MTFFCPAKINLHLDVGPLRSDGFHPISSIFIMVDLYDVLEIVSGPAGAGIRVLGNQGVSPDKDIISRAAQAFEADTDRRGFGRWVERRCDHVART